MKAFKNFIILTLFMISISPAFAQFSFGVKGGYVQAWQEYGDFEVPEDVQIHINGFQLSTMIYYQQSPYISIGIEPGFSKRGAACIPGGFIVEDQESKFMLNYLEAPVMIQFQYPIFNSNLRTFGKVGVGSSYVLKGTRIDEFPDQTQNTSNPISFEGQSPFKRWDHGLYAGLGFSVPCNRNELFVESNFYGSLRDFDENNTSKNRSIFIGLGYRFFL